MPDSHDRRAFLRAAAAASAAWATADLLQVEQALAWASAQANSTGVTTTSLSRAQAEVVDAVTSRILPSVDGRPGAHEAGAVYFIDQALASFNAGQKKLYRDGISDLNRRADVKWRGTRSFAALAPPRQDELLRDIEQTPFFAAVRFDTIVGTFALPSYGGNRGHIGWHLLGLDHQPTFQAPFGYYDAEATRGR